MTEWVVTITKAKSDDGHWSLSANGIRKVGDTLNIDLDSRRPEKVKPKGGGAEFVADVVNELKDDGTYGGIWPVELLEGL